MPVKKRGMPKKIAKIEKPMTKSKIRTVIFSFSPPELSIDPREGGFTRSLLFCTELASRFLPLEKKISDFLVPTLVLGFLVSIDFVSYFTLSYLDYIKHFSQKQLVP